MGFRVNPPNGRNVETYLDNQYTSPIGRIIGEIIKLAWTDILTYVTDSNSACNTLDFLSACYFVTGDLYQLYCNELALGSNSNVDFANLLPPGVDEKVIRDGAKEYERLEELEIWTLVM